MCILRFLSLFLQLKLSHFWLYLYQVDTTLLYEGHLESSYHVIITPQCVDKMLSNNIFLETRIQRLLDGLIFVEKGLGVHVQRMLKMGRALSTGGIFKQNTWLKAKENWGPYLQS